jgi:hypothetical protein
MATSDKLPTFEQIWGAPAPTFIKASRATLELIRAELAKPKPRKARTAKRIRKSAKGSKRK